MEGWRNPLRGARRRLGRPSSASPSRRRPSFVVDIAVGSGDELSRQLVEQGLAADEVIFKCFWPRYLPPADAGIRSLVRTENLGLQFDRLVAMHRCVPSAVPMPFATVRSADGALVGYVLEYVAGETLLGLIERGAVDEARRQLRSVERAVGRLHAKSLPHGDLTPANVIAADDGRTVLIDPVANPGPGTALQDELCLREIRGLLDA